MDVYQYIKQSAYFRDRGKQIYNYNIERKFDWSKPDRLKKEDMINQLKNKRFIQEIKKYF